VTFAVDLVSFISIGKSNDDGRMLVFFSFGENLIAGMRARVK